jgi:2,4-dienoyl-CoA reductase (NADPH2)
MLDRAGVTLRLGTEATPAMLGDFDEVIVATGVRPRDPAIPGQDGPNVLGYIDVLARKAPVGPRVAIIGAGGIGFDVATFLAEGEHSLTTDPEGWKRAWGVGDPALSPGGLAEPAVQPAVRQIHLLQRKAEKPGRGLGKTTGWIHRAALAQRGVAMVGGVNYDRIDATGLWISHGEKRENPEHLAVDTIVLCAGQVSERGLADALAAAGRPVHVIGGADQAGELDAKRAIDQGTRLALGL